MTRVSCSFCGKSQEDAFHIVAGPACYICDACVALAFDIVAEARERVVRTWVERLRAALDDLYRNPGNSALDAAAASILEEDGADERLADAGRAARRMIAELREVRAVLVAAEVKVKEVGG